MTGLTAVFILGPTATGKTDFSISLAKKVNGEIISCDSRQFYRELNIGTAKPTTNQLNEIKHHFINSLSVHQPYTVADFEEDALKIIEKLFREGRVPIIVGGSGLFAKAISEGLDKIPETDPAIRKQLVEELQNDGINVLLEKLKILDNQYFNEVDKNNPRRIIRALEVCISTGKPFSYFRQKAPQKRNFNILKTGFYLPTNILYTKIDERCEQMLQQGLLEEVKFLYQWKDLPALKTIGYQEFFDYMEKKTSLPEAIKLFKQHSRNYAKRQMTWFRKDSSIRWFDANEKESAEKYLIEMLNQE